MKQQDSGVEILFEPSDQSMTLNIEFAAKKILATTTYKRWKYCNKSASNNIDAIDVCSDELDTSDYVSNKIKDAIRYTSSLDLLHRPRLSRLFADKINVDKEFCHATKDARHLCIDTALLWGWHDPYKTKKCRW